MYFHDFITSFIIRYKFGILNTEIAIAIECIDIIIERLVTQLVLGLYYNINRIHLFAYYLNYTSAKWTNMIMQERPHVLILKMHGLESGYWQWGKQLQVITYNK